jgi:DNA-binding MarR family transcriptional regulator
MPTTTATRLDIESLADRLRPALLKLSRHLRREAQRVGLSVLDAQLLGVIDARPGIGVSQLAEVEQMTRPAMSAHVKRLEEAGWIARQADAPDGDRRRVGLALTPEGAAMLQDIRRMRTDWLAGRLSALSPAEFDALALAAGPLARLVEVAS